MSIQARLIAGFAAILMGISLGWWVCGLKDAKALESALKAQRASLEQSCAEDKKLTEENSRVYQDQIKDLTGKLAAAKRVLPSRCVMPAAGKASGGAGQAGAGKHAGSDGVTSDALLDFAGECERYRLQVISLQGFIDDTWKR